MWSILLQINVVGDTTQAAAHLVEQTTKDGLSFWELSLKGGWMMIPILLLSVLAVYIFFERYFVIQKASKMGNHFMEQIQLVLYVV
jgi:biopolymer transport protein ExbB